MRTPKGWTGPAELDGNPIMNSFRAHQVPLPAAGTDDEQFEMLKSWLASYKPEQLFDETPSGNFVRDAVTKILPADPNMRLGQIKEAWPEYQALNLPPDWQQFTTAAGENTSPMKASTFFQRFAGFVSECRQSRSLP